MRSDRAQQDFAGENAPQSWPHAQAINRNTPRLERRRAAASRRSCGPPRATYVMTPRSSASTGMAVHLDGTSAPLGPNCPTVHVRGAPLHCRCGGAADRLAYGSRHLHGGHVRGLVGWPTQHRALCSRTSGLPCRTVSCALRTSRLTSPRPKAGSWCPRNGLITTARYRCRLTIACCSELNPGRHRRAGDQTVLPPSPPTTVCTVRLRVSLI